MRSDEFLKQASYYLKIPTDGDDVHWEEVINFADSDKDGQRYLNDHGTPLLLTDTVDLADDKQLSAPVNKWFNYNVSSRGKRLTTYQTGLTPNGKLITGIKCKGLNGFPDSEEGLGMDAYGWAGFLLYNENVDAISQIVEDKFWGKLKRQKRRGLFTDASGNKQPMPGWWIAKFRYSLTMGGLVQQVPRKMDAKNQYLFYLIYVPPTEEGENIHILRVNQGHGLVPISKPETGRCLLKETISIDRWPYMDPRYGMDAFAFGMKGFNGNWLRNLADSQGSHTGGFSAGGALAQSIVDNLESDDSTYSESSLGIEVTGDGGFDVMSNRYWARNRHIIPDIKGYRPYYSSFRTDLKARKFWRKVRNLMKWQRKYGREIDEGNIVWMPNREIVLKDYFRLWEYHTLIGTNTPNYNEPKGNLIKGTIPSSSDSGMETPLWQLIQPSDKNPKRNPYQYRQDNARRVGVALGRSMKFTDNSLFVDYLELSPEQFNNSFQFAHPITSYSSWPDVAEKLTSSGHMAYIGPSLTGLKVEEQHLNKRKYEGLPPFKQIALINYNVRLPRVVRQWTPS